jgi:hypothetical protein
MVDFWSNPKGIKTTGKAPTRAQERRWTNIRLMGCIVCRGVAEIHHCFTGSGGRKKHDLTIGLCFRHHRGVEGIHPLSRNIWEPIYGTEQKLLDKTNAILRGENVPIQPK